MHRKTTSSCFLMLSFILCTSCLRNITSIEDVLFSPNRSFKLLLVKADAGVASESIIKVYLLRSDLEIRRNTTPVFIALSTSIDEVSWSSENKVLIRYLSDESIRYQVIRDHEFTIEYELRDTSGRSDPAP